MNTRLAPLVKGRGWSHAWLWRGTLLPLLFLFATCGNAPLRAEQASHPGHRLIKAGCNSKSVAIVDATGAIEWEYPIEQETSDAWLLESGNIIFAFKKGVREVTREKKTVWEYLAPEKAEIHSCQPLPGGLFLVSETHKDIGFLYEMDSSGTKHRTLSVPSKAGPHGQFRQTRKTAANTYLVTYMSGKTLELRQDGSIAAQFPVGSFVALRLPNGHTLVAGGDAHCLVEYDTQQKEVWRLDRNDLPGNTLGFVAGLHRLSNGNVVFCNWSGHGGIDNQAQLLEVTRDKKVVWKLKDPRLNMISSVTVLDQPDQQSPFSQLR